MRPRLIAAFALTLAPLATRAADDDGPFKNAKVGDYATYKSVMKSGDLTIRSTVVVAVVEKTDKELTLKTVVTAEEGDPKSRVMELTTKVDRSKPFDWRRHVSIPGDGEHEFEKQKEGREKLKLGVKEYDAAWTTYRAKTKVMGEAVELDFKVWVAKDTPLGVVKSTMLVKSPSGEAETASELIEAGNAK